MPGLLYVAVSRVRRHEHIKFVDLPDREGDELVDFTAVELPEDVMIHVTKELEDLWRQNALRSLPGPDFGVGEARNQAIDADVAEEFYLPVEEEKEVDALLAEYENDDFFSGRR